MRIPPAKELLSVPNLLSYLRLLLIPLFLYISLTAQVQTDHYLAAAIVVLSGLTDFADGFIARRFHMVTDFGKGLDPVADKLTQAAIVIVLMFKVKWMFLLFILFAVKELTMGASYLILRKKGKKLNGALWFGKVSTTFFYIATFVMIAVPGENTGLLYTLMAISGAFLLFSFVMYLRVYIKMYRSA